MRNREIDMEHRGFVPSVAMDNTHYHDCFGGYFQISGGRFHHLEPGNVLWIFKLDLHQFF